MRMITLVIRAEASNSGAALTVSVPAAHAEGPWDPDGRHTEASVTDAMASIIHVMNNGGRLTVRAVPNETEAK